MNFCNEGLNRLWALAGLDGWLRRLSLIFQLAFVEIAVVLYPGHPQTLHT